jgi:hypothetical protein
VVQAEVVARAHGDVAGVANDPDLGRVEVVAAGMGGAQLVKQEVAGRLVRRGCVGHGRGACTGRRVSVSDRALDPEQTSPCGHTVTLQG